VTRVIKPETPYLEKNHKAQFSTNQILKDEIEKIILIVQKDYKNSN
jgi:hypothetical protein